MPIMFVSAYVEVHELHGFYTNIFVRAFLFLSTQVRCIKV